MNRNDGSNSGDLGRSTEALCCSSRSDFPPSTLALQVGSHSKLAFLPVLALFPHHLSLFLSFPLCNCPDLLSSADLSHPDANSSLPFASLWLCWEGQQQLLVITAILTAAGKFSPQTHCCADLSSKGSFHLLLHTANIQTLQKSHKPTIYCSLLQEVKVNMLPQCGL